jgi:hypothetical protein
MKVKTNIRAGQGQKRNSVGTESVDVVVVPVSRCAGV